MLHAAVELKVPFAIAARFRERILRGELAPGEPLPVENDLTRELAVSKATVREAMRILEAEGFVEVRRGLGGGPRARRPSIGEAAKGMGAYLQMEVVRVLDVWESRDRIIGAAVERLAASPSPAAADLLRAHADRLGVVVGDHPAFHQQLVLIGEVAVETAANDTDVALVSALRHIIAADLEFAAEWARDLGAPKSDLVLESQRSNVGDWLRVARHVGLGQREAARRAYDSQAARVREGLSMIIDDEAVVDAVRSNAVHGHRHRRAVPPSGSGAGPRGR